MKALYCRNIAFSRVTWKLGSYLNGNFVCVAKVKVRGFSLLEPVGS